MESVIRLSKITTSLLATPLLPYYANPMLNKGIYGKTAIRHVHGSKTEENSYGYNKTGKSFSSIDWNLMLTLLGIDFSDHSCRCPTFLTLFERLPEIQGDIISVMQAQPSRDRA
jgi:hypothetical protein